MTDQETTASTSQIIDIVSLIVGRMPELRKSGQLIGQAMRDDIVGTAGARGTDAAQARL